MPNKIEYAFRITHIDNMPYILKHGFVLPSSPLRSDSYINIGDSLVIEARKNKLVNNSSIYECIPFYFGPRTPMLYVIQNGHNGVTRVEPENIIYCVVRLNDIIISNIDCIFSDGHILNFLSSLYDKNQLSNINNIINATDVYAKYWKSDDDPDLKRRKEAELLAKSDIPSDMIAGFVVYNDNAKNILIDMGVPSNKIFINPNYYF